MDNVSIDLPFDLDTWVRIEELAASLGKSTDEIALFYLSCGVGLIPKQKN